jgi:hypothetical protein
MFTFRLYFHTIDVKTPLNLVFRSPRFSLSIVPKSLGIPIRFGLTAVAHSVRVGIEFPSGKVVRLHSSR